VLHPLRNQFFAGRLIFGIGEFERELIRERVCGVGVSGETIRWLPLLVAETRAGNTGLILSGMRFRPKLYPAPSGATAACAV